ncbi:MAG: phospholipase D-like domain-containing protein [Chitinophagaceae bacterium]|nr:phospholipase D-like domain-containing protein [Chitinophagaceae bacterium]
MNWVLIIELLYIGILLTVCLRIIYDTRTSSKTLAYLLIAIFLPVAGMVFYFSFGINYRKRKLYNGKWLVDEDLLESLRSTIEKYTLTSSLAKQPELKQNRELASLLSRGLRSLPTRNNRVKVLVNGEEKFPELMDAIRKAEHHIHIEYYIFEDDEIGTQFAELLMEKARQGVQVRVIYDDFGSRAIRKKLVPRMREAGVKAFPFHRVIFLLLANRINYRNHRKIVVIDGKTAFTGGMNVSDNYVNKQGLPNSGAIRICALMVPEFIICNTYFFATGNFARGSKLNRMSFYFPLRPSKAAIP